MFVLQSLDNQNRHITQTNICLWIYNSRYIRFLLISVNRGAFIKRYSYFIEFQVNHFVFITILVYMQKLIRFSIIILQRSITGEQWNVKYSYINPLTL